MLVFDELETLLGNLNSGIQASECHGFMTGYLCIADKLDGSIWEFLCADMAGAPSIPARDQAALFSLGQDINDRMISDDLDFDLYQPEDSAPLADRCDALALWCQGFLSGLGVAGRIDWSAVSEACQEMIADLSDISRLGTETGEGENMEASLMELQEYVRVGAIYIHDEFALLKAENEQPEVLH